VLTAAKARENAQSIIILDKKVIAAIIIYKIYIYSGMIFESCDS